MQIRLDRPAPSRQLASCSSGAMFGPPSVDPDTRVVLMRSAAPAVMQMLQSVGTCLGCQ